MRNFVAYVLFVCVLVVTPAFAQDTDKVLKAKAAAQLWLASADAGLYGKTWEQAAAPFQNAVTKADWEVAVKAARAPLGSLKSRSVSSAIFTDHLPGAPKGEYVVIQYASDYTNRQEVIETVTPMLAADGTWKVSGYYVK
ncbi:MAG TPA: DUF4019 domain-containing protein [Duganella sp.]|jgi:hypothetical protein